MKSLFLHKTPHGEHIFAATESETFDIVGSRGFGRSVHTVENEICIGAMIFFCHYILDKLRNYYYLIAEFRAAVFAGFEHAFSEFSPLLAVVFRAMISHHHLHAQQTPQWSHQTRSVGMHMHNVGMQSASLDNA